MILSLKLNKKQWNKIMLESLLHFDDGYSVIEIENTFLIITKELT